MKFDIGLLRLTGALVDHSMARQSVIAENIANADTPGFKARDIQEFGEVFGPPEKVGSRMKATLPGHIGYVGADASFEPKAISSFAAESPNGNTVSLEEQVAKSAEVRHAHDLALGVYAKSLAILKTSLGRRS